jgi:integrase
MFGPLEALLTEWRTQWEPNPYNLVFAGTDGQPIDPDRATEKWPDVLKAAGIDKHVVIHGLRHTAVDIAYAAGIPEAVIIELFGHSAVAMSRAYRSKGNRLMLDDAARKFAAQFQLDAP